MFHRVKSENQNDPQNPEAAQETEAQDKPLAAREPERRPAGYAPAQPQYETSAQREKTETAPSASATLDIPAPSYQRTHQFSPARPSAPSYPAKSYAAPSYSPSQSADQSENDRRLTIGRGITMSGEIEACDYLLVEGTVEAALKGASALNIAETGTFYGTVEIQEAVIAGRFEGEITVNGRLTIKSSGVITGTIAYKELEVESGAVIDGRLTPVSSSGAASRTDNRAGKQSAPRAKQQPSSKPSKPASSQDAANADGELFGDSMSSAAE